MPYLPVRFKFERLTLLYLSTALVLLLTGCVASNPASSTPVPSIEGLNSAGASLTASSSPPATPLPTRSPRIVVIDPGHGGPEDAIVHRLPDGGYWWEGPRTGAGRMLASGQMLWEKDLTLQVAQVLGNRLRQAGYRVVLTRTTDQEVNSPSGDQNGDGIIDLADDLQARVDMANAAGAELFLSIHFNADPAQQGKGVTTIYCAARPFAHESRRLAELTHRHVRDALRSLGYDAPDRGVVDDERIGPPGHLLVLGPSGPKNPRPSLMPGVLVEPLFLTDPEEFELATRSDVLEALATGLAEAVEEFLGPPEPAP